MSLKTRRIIFILFIIIFIIITPLIISYASGYRFSFPRKIIQKTGLLVLDSRPPGAKIYINDKLYQLFFNKYFSNKNNYTTTPAKIKGILPNEYNVRLELGGYWPWQKKIKISGGGSEYYDEIILFKKDLPSLVNKDDARQISVSPDKKFSVAIKDNNEINFINLITGEKNNFTLNSISSPYSSTTQPANFTILWPASGQRVLIGDEIVALPGFKILINLNKFIQPDASGIQWSLTDENIIYYKNKNGIFNFNLSNNKIKTILNFKLNGLIGQNNYNPFLIKNNNIFLINQADKSSSLDIYELNSNNFFKSIKLPYCPECNFINFKNKYINIYNDDNKILYIIDPLSTSYFPVKKDISNIWYFDWIDDDKLLYANEFEIWIADIYNNTENLLTRISEPIKAILWHTAKYIIYATDNKINLLEMELDNKRNNIELIDFKNISSIYLNAVGDILYFYTGTGAQKELYKLNIL